MRWYERMVVYQIYPLSFYDSNNDGIGDIKGIISKLDYLKLLGIDIIWLSPLYKSPMDDNGYDISDYYQINEMFGTMEDFKQLLNKAHSLGIKIIMDLVVNHTSDEHYYFKEALKDKNSIYRDFYIWRKNINNELPNDITSIFSGPAWELDEKSNEYYFHLFSKRQPDLNWDNPLLRKEIYQMINWWLDLGIDGFRLDVIDLIGKDVDSKAIFNGPKLHERLQEMNEHCFMTREIFTVGETPCANVEIAQTYTNLENKQLDMIFTFSHMSLDEVPGKGKWELKKLNLIELKHVFKHWQQGLYQTGWNSLYWSNHDQPRIVSRFGDDTIYRVESAKMLATLLHFMQGTPFIYQGEEIGMTNIKLNDIYDYKDIETLNMYKEKRELGWQHEKIMQSIYAKGRDNARTPMQWNDSLNGGFTESIPWLVVNSNYNTINVQSALQDNNSLFYYYKKLIQLRKQLDVIIYGDFKLIFADHKEIFAYERKYKNESLLVICNFYNNELEIELDDNNYELIICNYNDFKISQKYKLRPYECFVLKY